MRKDLKKIKLYFIKKAILSLYVIVCELNILNKTLTVILR